MRRYILVRFNKATLKPKFKVEEMPSLGRLDIAARSVLYGLWKSYGIRDDTEVYLYFGDTYDGVLMVFKGKEIRKLSPNEREIGIYISKSYTIFSHSNKEIINYNGVYVRKDNFENVVRYLRNKSSKVVLLDKSGGFILERTFGKVKDVVIILGDNVGINEEELSIINKVCRSKLYIVSLGEEEYLTTQAITIMHWYLDNQNIIM